jgi:hypothetical protein
MIWPRLLALSGSIKLVDFGSDSNAPEDVYGLSLAGDRLDW